MSDAPPTPADLAELRRMYDAFAHDNAVCAPTARRVVKTDELFAAWRALPALLAEIERLRTDSDVLTAMLERAMHHVGRLARGDFTPEELAALPAQLDRTLKVRPVPPIEPDDLPCQDVTYGPE